MMKKWNRYFWILFIIAISVRILILTEFPHAIHNVDSGGYTHHAHRLMEEGYSVIAQRPLGYPLLLAGILTITGDYLAVVILQMIIGIAISVLFYHMFWEIKPDKNASLWTFGFISLGTLGIVFEISILPDFLFSVFLSLIFWIIIRLHKGETKLSNFILLGLFVGIATILKPQGLFLALFGIVLSIFTYKGVKNKLKKIIISSGLFYLFFLSIVCTLATYNYYRNGSFTLTHFFGHQLFSVSGQLIDFDSPNNQEIKKIIKPYIMKYKKDKDKLGIIWLNYTGRGGPRKVMWEYVGGSLKKYNQLCFELAIEGITKHPFLFLQRTLKVFVKSLFLATEVTSNFHKSHDFVVERSFGHMKFMSEQGHLFGIELSKIKEGKLSKFDLLKYNSTHPRVSRKLETHNELINPLHSPGSFVRSLLIISPLRWLPIWIWGFILSFYLLFFRYHVFSLKSPLIISYVIVLFQFTIHAMLSNVSSRYIYPDLNIMIFFVVLAFSKKRLK